MGAAESTEGEPDAEEVSFSSLCGYRVMKVFSGSPATRAGLAPFEDFILAVDGVLCDSVENTLGTLLKHNEAKEVDLLLWNCIDEKERHVSFKPMRWSGPGLLGAAVKHEKLENASDCVWHVIDLTPRSPADEAGLVPDTDYIVGTPAAAFQKEEELHGLIREAGRMGQVITLSVYSSATGRLVVNSPLDGSIASRPVWIVESMWPPKLRQALSPSLRAQVVGVSESRSRGWNPPPPFLTGTKALKLRTTKIVQPPVQPPVHPPVQPPAIIRGGHREKIAPRELEQKVDHERPHLLTARRLVAEVMQMISDDLIYKSGE